MRRTHIVLSYRLYILPSLSAVCLLSLFALSICVVQGQALPGDWSFVQAAIAMRSDILTRVIWLLTFITSSAPTLAVCLALCVVEWRRVRRLPASHSVPVTVPPGHAVATRLPLGSDRIRQLNARDVELFIVSVWPAIAFGGALVTNIVMRITIGRTRPGVEYIAQALPELQADFQRFSFPSGHAGSGLVAYSAMAIVAWRVPALRAIGVIAASLIVTGTGFGRVYLGVHWPSDVIAGYLLGAAWVTFVLTLYQRRIFGKDA